MRARHLAPLTLLLACSDYGFGVPDAENDGGLPEIDVSPQALDFLSAGPGETVLRTFTVANVGDVYLEVEPLVLSGADSFSLLTTDTPPDLLPGEWFEVEVAFTPLEGGGIEGSVLVASSDADQPEIPVSLIGKGLVPVLQIVPEAHDFGALTVPCDDDLDLVLQNIGAADLTVDSLALEGAGFTLVDGPDVPLVLPPGAYATATVQFLPTEEGTFSAVLTAASDDPHGDRQATQAGEGTGGDAVVDTFPVVTDPPLDILFAVDQSASMDDDTISLGENFEAFVTAIAEVTSGWQVGVVTLDDGCINGGVLDATTPGLVPTFQDAVTIGDDLDIVNDEALLRLADLALQEAGPGGCSEGLLREDSPLHVIVVSDEPERSHEQAAAWTWDFWVDTLGAHLADPSRLTISGIVDRDHCNEGDDGYAEAIAATGGAHLSICDADWAADVAALAAASTAGTWSYALSGEPVEETLAVTVDGAAATGWTWDAAGNAVVFAEQPAGEEVTVRYQVTGTCE